MVAVLRYFLPACALLVSACGVVGGSSLPISANDRVNPWFGPAKHYEHIVRDSSGAMRDVYRYYLDSRGRPVLDGPRVIYRRPHDPGHTLLYRDGRTVREYDNIVTG